MCGILAVSFQSEQDGSSKVNRIITAFKLLANRGPDSGSLVITDSDILAFRRLAIVDQSVKGNQPFYHDSSKLVCNGEIYNHEQLKYKYKIPCDSVSDCDCLLYLFHQLGFRAMLSELNGVYAMIIMTPSRVYFARDQIGVRPLFYGFLEDGSFALASYARALLEFCPVVKQVLPGWGEFDINSGKLSLSPYDHTPMLVRNVFPNLEVMIRNILSTAVQARLMSDRPVGCLLSGGLDSSLITSILCRLIGPEKVRTYSIGMKGSQDLKYARLVADYLGTNHTEVLFSPEEGFAAIPEVIRDLESYDITTVRASVGMWLLAKYISQNTDDVVLLSGEGADELFCGYLYFHYAPDSDELEKESLRLVQELYLYDVLRADRCVSSHGLELRVPFLDKSLVKFCLSLSGELRKPVAGMEKSLLRESFKKGYLPEEVLNRRKDGMSDGISGSKKKWFEQIQEFVGEEVKDEDIGSEFPHEEAYYYKIIYDKIFPTYQPKHAYWLPKWVDHGGDPSGRILSIFAKEK